MVSIAAFQAVDPGSIPGHRIKILFWRNFTWIIPDIYLSGYNAKEQVVVSFGQEIPMAEWTEEDEAILGGWPLFLIRFWTMKVHIEWKKKNGKVPLCFIIVQL